MELRRLYPEPGRVPASEALTGLGLAELAPPDRPYLVLNMVATADGKATLEGRTREMSSEADRTLFHNLRTQADAIMVGAGTVRVERYGKTIKNEELREQRVREGLDPNPPAIVVSARLNLPADLPLLQDPESRVLILTSADTELPDVPAQIEYLHAHETDIDTDSDEQSRPREADREFRLSSLLKTLRTQHGIRSILCEGGPSLNAQLFEERLVDELFLAIAPLISGATDPPTIVDGPPLQHPTKLTLTSALEHDANLFLRYHINHQ